MSVEAAVERDLRRLGGDLRDSTLAAAALTLAARMDNESNSTTSVSMCAKELRDTMAALRALAPPERKVDAIDDLATRRAERRRAAAGGAET